jgi:hypothetical protein
MEYRMTRVRRVDSVVRKADPAASFLVRTLRPLITLSSCVLVIGCLYWGQAILIPMALAILITFVLGPVVSALRRIGLPQTLAVLLVVILALALGSAERGITLARLTVMGHERAAGLVMTEAMPAVLTAIAAGVACAIALPLVIGSAIDLSAFTGTSIPVRLQPDALALGLPAVIIGVLALAALAAEARSLSRRDVAGLLRAH